jgi:hypothetical protein
VTRRAAADLAALADGTLAVQNRAAVMKRVTRSISMSRALDQQRLAVSVVRSLTDPAPARLRAWVERACSDTTAVQDRRRTSPSL